MDWPAALVPEDDKSDEATCHDRERKIRTPKNNIYHSTTDARRSDKIGDQRL
jgi:hypothetical protein